MRDGTEAICSIDTLSEFRGRMKGSVLVVGPYDGARRIWNGAHDKRPALIARCAGVADVIEAVNFGRHTGALVAIRGGSGSIGPLRAAERTVRPLTRTGGAEHRQLATVIVGCR
jgi:hypothetical protein